MDYHQWSGTCQLPRAGIVSCFAVSPAARAAPGTEEALREINMCGMNGCELYKLRMLLKPRGWASNRPGGGTQEGLLESAMLALSVKEG